MSGGDIHEATFCAEYDDLERARRVGRAIRPEVDDIESDRTRATVSRTDDRLAVTIAASDLVALRAGLNTWLTLIDVAERAGGCTGRRNG
jgi:KEOPS complex subunit Pcc1